MSRMPRMVATLALALVLGMLAGCEEEVLTVGELRCRGVSCAPHTYEQAIPEGHEKTTLVHSEVVARPAFIELPCPGEGACEHILYGVRLLERDGASSLLVVWGFHEDDHRTVRVGRYEDGEWLGTSAIEIEDDLPLSTLGIAIDPERPGEAIIALNESAVSQPNPPGRLRAFHYDERDELALLFEAEDIGFLRNAAAVDGELLIASTIIDHRNLEVARYAADGTLRWRQTALKALEYGPEVIPSDDVQLGVLEGGRIAVLVPNGSIGHYEVLVLDGTGEKLWCYPAPGVPNGKDMLVTAGDAVVITANILGGGYSVSRVERRDGELDLQYVTRGKKQFYDVNAFSVQVAPSGWAYVATQDGVFDEHQLLIERASPDSRVIESIVLDGPDDGPCAMRPDAFWQLLPVADEQSAFISTGRCIAEVALPPLPE